MSSGQDTPGGRIARARRRRGLSQAVLAGLVTGWVARRANG